MIRRAADHHGLPTLDGVHRIPLWVVLSVNTYDGHYYWFDTQNRTVFKFELSPSLNGFDERNLGPLNHTFAWERYLNFSFRHQSPSRAWTSLDFWLLPIEPKRRFLRFRCVVLESYWRL